MKNLFIIILSFTSLSIFAGSKSYSLKFEVNKPIESLLSIYTDYESTCMNGCPYHSPSVKEIKVLNSYRTPRDFYIWISIDDLKDAQSFYKINITGDNERTVVTQTQLDKKDSNRFSRASGLNNNPLFRTNDITTTFIKSTENHTVVKFDISVSYGIILAPLGGRIQDAIEDIAHSARDNLIR